MTSYPPPGPPQGESGAGQQPGGYQPPPPNYGPPGQSPPPPPAGYGQPGGQYPPPPQGQQYPPPQQYGQYGGPQGSAAKATFDFNSVNPLDWAILGAGLLAFIFSFFEYYTASAKGQLKQACNQGLLPSSNCSNSEDAWHGFFGWFGVLLLVIAAGLTALVVFQPKAKLPFPARLVAIASATLGLVFTFIALFVTPHKNVAVPPGTKLSDFVDFGRGFSYWIILILAIGATGLAILRFQQTGGDLAALFSGGSTKQQTGVYGPPQNYPPQQGYQQQAPSGYQSPPAYEQQGYQPQPPPGGYQPPAGYQPPPPQQPGYQPQPPPAQPQGEQPPPPQPQG